MLEDKIDKTSGSAVWANDNKTIFYTKKDPQTLRQNRVYKHVVGTPESEDVLVFEEKDETFYCWVTKSKNQEYIMIGSGATLSTEIRFLSADTPDGDWKIIHPREMNHEYSVSHYGDHFYINTNKDAKNFKLMKAPVSDTRFENWVDVIPHRDDVLFEGVEIFASHLVVEGENRGINPNKNQELGWRGRLLP